VSEREVKRDNRGYERGKSRGRERGKKSGREVIIFLFQSWFFAIQAETERHKTHATIWPVASLSSQERITVLSVCPITIPELNGTLLGHSHTLSHSLALKHILTHNFSHTHARTHSNTYTHTFERRSLDNRRTKLVNEESR